MSHPYPTIVVLACAVMLGSPCGAQVVVGRVVDRERGHALANAYAASPTVMLRAGVAPQARSGGSGGAFGCAPMIYLDGVPVQQGGDLEPHEYFDLESVGLEAVLGIEVYDSPAETPAIFSGGSAACGVIAIWLR